MRCKLVFGKQTISHMLIIMSIVRLEVEGIIYAGKSICDNLHSRKLVTNQIT